MNQTNSKPVVLLAEEDEAIARARTAALRLNGLAVVWAPTGEVALSLAMGAPPDVLVTDWLLSGLDGVALCRLFRKDPKLAHVPIILALPSSLAWPAAPVTAAETIYLTKPVSDSVLCATIFSLLPGAPARASSYSQRPMKGAGNEN
ncbi:response regulator transcription factor [Paraburkholderia sp. BR10954]|uniref:response regulator transcription factor n=1 Tax=Paraburkholderia sp. BR10954 TaxID=3236995 RepID=UPI0034D309CD